MLPRRLALLLAILLLITGAARIGWMAGHQPLLGYANQFDMGRTSACFGLWPNLPEPARYQAHREAPIAQYIEGEHRADECYVSSELLFTGIAMATWKLAADAGLATSTAMDFRYVGAVKAMALILLALIFTRLLRERPAWMVIHAAVFALLLADPMVTLWLNTLYTEFAAVFFAYAAVMCLVMIAGDTPDRGGWYLGFGLALLGLGLSRQQHALLPAWLVLLAWPAIWRNQRRLALPLVIAACTVIALQAVVIARPPTISAANNVNVVLGTLLPAAGDQDEALARLGLPPGCAAVIGATWYVTMGENVGARCPGVMTLPRLQVLKLLAAEPMIAVRALMKAAPLSQPALLQYVGIEENKAYGSLKDQSSMFAFSIATAVEGLPLAVYLGVQVAALLAFAVSLSAWTWMTIRRGSPSPEAVLASTLAGIFAYASLTSLFGDGLVEFSRHTHLGSVALYALVLLGAVLLALRLGATVRGRGKVLPATPAPGASWLDWALLAAVTAVPLSSSLWLSAWKQQPLAIGVVDEPKSNTLSSSTVTVHGWVMDPFGPSRAVIVVNGMTRLDTHPWLHPTDSSGAGLARVFPTYRDPANARFERVIDAASFGGGPISVRTYAQNRDGIMTEIDRRVLAQGAR
jgi:hypothetical protein